MFLIGTIVLGHDSIAFHVQPAPYRAAVKRLIHTKEPVTSEGLAELIPYLSEETRNSIELFQSGETEQFAADLAAISILVQYRKHFIGLPEFAEERLNLIYGYESSPVPWLLLCLLCLSLSIFGRSLTRRLLH